MRGQGRAFRRGAIWWVAYYHRGQEIRESSRSTKRSVAQRLLRERLRTAGTPAFLGPVAERLGFEDLAAIYLTDFRVNGRRSIADAERNVRELRLFFGLSRVLDITAEQVSAYI